MKKILFCMPTYNEAENITTILPLIEAECSKIQGYEFGVQVIDDNSPDGTGAIVREYAKTSKLPITLIEREGKQGLGKAYVHGFKEAIEKGAYAVIMMDADLSHDPKYLPQLVAGLDTHDFVVGSRYTKGGGVVNWGLKRQFISRGGNIYSQLILLVGVRDLTAGFNCIKTDVLKAINIDTLKSNGYGFQIELKYRSLKAGFKIKEVPIIFKDREKGTSKFDGGIFKEAIFIPWKLRLGKK